MTMLRVDEEDNKTRRWSQSIMTKSGAEGIATHKDFKIIEALDEDYLGDGQGMRETFTMVSFSYLTLESMTTQKHYHQPNGIITPYPVQTLCTSDPSPTSRS